MAERGTKTRVHVRSRHNLIAKGLRLLCERQGLAVVAKTSADVLLVDLSDAVQAFGPPESTPTLALIRGGEAEAEALLRLGYRGYLSPGVDERTLARALNAVADGQLWAERKLITLALVQRQATDRAQGGRPILTRRERAVFELIRRGMSNREISQRLAIAEKTVKGHATSLYNKLGVKGRASLLFGQVSLPDGPGE